MRKIRVLHSMLALIVVLLAADLMAQEWNLPLQVVCTSSKEDTLSYLGINPDATDSFDLLYDFPEPPPPPGYWVRLFFPHPEWGLIFEEFNSDVRSPIEEDSVKIWTFHVQTNHSTNVELTWPDLSQVPEDYLLFLFPISVGDSINMRDSSHYSFSVPDELYTSTFQVVVQNTEPPWCNVSSDSLDFGTICLGDSSYQSFTITNIGGGILSGDVEVIESCDDFSVVSPTTYDLGSGESAVFTIKFQPLSSGIKNCIIETGNDICNDVSCLGEAEECLPVKVILPCCTAESGDTVSIPIWVDDVTGRGIDSVHLRLVYDGSILEGNCDLTTTQNTIAEIWDPPTCNSTYGSISVAMGGMTSLSGSGALVYIAFIVNGFEGDTTTIHFDQMQFNEGDPPSSCQDGLFTVRSFVYGDINCDGDINGEDVICLLNYLYRKGPPPCPLLAGDANCDGDVNGEDIIVLLNYIYRNGPEPGC